MFEGYASFLESALLQNKRKLSVAFYFVCIYLIIISEFIPLFFRETECKHCT